MTREWSWYGGAVKHWDKLLKYSLVYSMMVMAPLGGSALTKDVMIPL